MANRKTTEKVTENHYFNTGYKRAVMGYGYQNPYVAESFEWMSFMAGWLAGRKYYMDEGWAVS